MYWIALTLLRPAPADDAARRLRPHLLAIAGVLVVTLTFGAFVAGLNGGLVYNSFPLMGGALVPDDAFQTAWSAFEDPGDRAIHPSLAGDDRGGAGADAAGCDGAACRATAAQPIDGLAAMALRARPARHRTLLLQVPIPLAAAHQAGAVVLWTLTLWSLHATR